MSTYQIITPDDSGCGVEITRTGPNGYALTGIETGVALGVALGPVAAIRHAGEYLMQYDTDAVLEYDDPDTGERVKADWSATVELGRQMVDGPQDFTEALDAALEDGEEG